jgi:hypothetical protein
VLRLVARGLSNAEIARELVIEVTPDADRTTADPAVGRAQREDRPPPI